LDRTSAALAYSKAGELAAQVGANIPPRLDTSNYEPKQVGGIFAAKVLETASALASAAYPEKPPVQAVNSSSRHSIPYSSAGQNSYLKRRGENSPPHQDQSDPSQADNSTLYHAPEVQQAPHGQAQAYHQPISHAGNVVSSPQYHAGHYTLYTTSTINSHPHPHVAYGSASQTQLHLPPQSDQPLTEYEQHSPANQDFLYPTHPSTFSSHSTVHHQQVHRPSIGTSQQSYQTITEPHLLAPSAKQDHSPKPSTYLSAHHNYPISSSDSAQNPHPPNLAPNSNWEFSNTASIETKYHPTSSASTLHQPNPSNFTESREPDFRFNTTNYQNTSAGNKAHLGAYHQSNHDSGPSNSPLVMTNAIKDMASRKSQFGFGGNHVVPSVPLPPNVQQAMQKYNAAKKRTAISTATSTSSATKVQRTSSPQIVAPTNGNFAYERKKLKAKQSRVLLNESIDRLSLAMNVAGQQSHHRLCHLSCLFHHDNTKNAMSECEAVSANAKKYERPSFIASAAAMVQALNDQCEALVQEVRYLKDHLCPPYTSSQTLSENQKNDTTELPPMFPDVSKNDSISTIHCQSKAPPTLSPSNPEQCCFSESSPGITIQNTYERSGFYESVDKQGNMTFLMSNGPVLASIVSFLDPKSICRCMHVCRTWAAIEIFRADNLWSNLCISRFGEEQMNVWQLKHSESILNKMQLYRAMNEANVAPVTKAEGNLHLGETRLQGISAWASMTARSNGETLRSVKTQTDGKGEVFNTLPVVELRIMVQNTGIETAIVVPEQPIVVDASTRRRREEYMEISSDDRLKKQTMPVHGSPETLASSSLESSYEEKFRLHLFDAVILIVHIHVKGCCTTAKFLKKANFTKLLVSTNGATRPMVIPIGHCEDGLFLEKRQQQLQN